MSGSLISLLADAELAAFVEALRATPGPSAREQGPVALREAQRNRVMARPRGPELAAAGVPVQHRCEPRMIHGFLTLDTVSPAAARAGERFFVEISLLVTRLAGTR